MTLVAATASTAPPTARSRPDDAPEGIPRHGAHGTPWVRRPDLAGPDPSEPCAARGAYYTRASGLGDCLESEYGLTRWKLGRVVFGMGRRTDLVRAAAALRDPDEDKSRAVELAEAAIEVAASSAGATSGTAFHLLSEREDAGENLSYLPADLLAALAAWRRLMAGFDVVATETFVVNDRLRAAGTFDRLVALRAGYMTAPDGTVFGPGDRLGVDLKSNKSAKHFGPKYKVQQAVYFGPDSRPYTHAGGRADWPGGVAPSHRWSLIPHVPIEHPEDADLLWVDLEEGAQLADLALAVRKARNAKGLPSAALPDPAAPSLDYLVSMIRSRDELDALYDQHAAAWTDELTAAARARLAQLEGVPA